jgi:L-lactate utilization protein LutC
MTTSRDAFLERVRHAVQAGNRPGTASSLPERGTIGYQGAGTDPVARFETEACAAGASVHIVPDWETAAAQVLRLVQAHSARKALVGRGRFIDALALPHRLRTAGLEVSTMDMLEAATSRDRLFAADVGISGVDYPIAETGTVVLKARPEEPRSLSLLPPLHIAVAARSQLLPDLFDLFALLSAENSDGAGGSRLPSCLTLITGPSKTGDIELRLVTGVHGPGEVHVVLCT